ncbi:MAG: hypothetical protein ABF741_01655 [Liquorilactobacillus ghanensis]|uniref:hypothetical protein n=1 Tax=Liquorilactobacillus ghanensis TaxID=399370 RepID=UPI0039E79D9B
MKKELKALIDNPYYLDTWINNVECSEKLTVNKCNMIWENVVFSNYYQIDNLNYSYLLNKLGDLKNKLGETFKLALVCSIGNLAKIVIQLNSLESEFQEAQRESNHFNKMKKMLNIYNSLAQGPFFDELDILIALISILKKQDFNKGTKTLGKAVTFLSSKKNDYSKFSNLADVQIRNSCDHNGVSYNEYNFTFRYTIGKSFEHKKINYSLFINNLKHLIKGSSTFVKLIVKLVSSEKITNNILLKYTIPEKRVYWFKLFLSSYKVLCNQFEITSTIDKHKQITLNFDGLDVSEDKRLWFTVQSSAMAYILAVNENIEFNRVFVSFKSPKTISSFIAFPTTKIKKYVNNELTYADFINVKNDNEIIVMYPINDDTTPSQEIIYHDIDHSDFSIKEIEDISTINEKVFKGILIASNITTIDRIKSVSLAAIKILKNLPNGGKQSYKTKHGTFPADRVYLVVYKSYDKKRALFKNNPNFITTVQYDRRKKFPINIDNQLLVPLKKQKSRNIEYRWNPNFK